MREVLKARVQVEKDFTIYTVVCDKDLQPVRKAVTTHVKNKI